MKYLCLLLVIITSVLPTKSIVAQNGTPPASDWYDLCKGINEKGATPIKASMASTLESPVNTLTGAVSFDIPVHTIELGSYSLPISLHYETSGFRATDIASNIGLGWSINGIGCITRTIKGFRDDSLQGYDNGSFDYIGFLMDEENLNIDNFPKLINLTEGCYDGEPDLYSFHFAGHSGSFINNVDDYGRIINFNEHNIKIERGNDEYAFSITDEVGNIYYFGGGNSNEHIDVYKNRQSCMTESYWNSYESLQIRFASGNSGKDNELDNDYDIAWHLSKIEIASSDYVIDFEYAHDAVKIYLGTDETYMYGHPFRDAAIYTPSNSFNWVAHRFNRFKYAKIPRISKISWKKGNSELGSIIFVPENEYRYDLQNDKDANHPGGYAIMQIKVMNSDGSVNNCIYLQHSYNGKTIPTNNDCDPSFYNTLFLDKLYCCDSDENTLYSYKFSYDGEHSKFARNTSYIDMWGYINDNKASATDPASVCRLIKPKIFYYENGNDNSLYNSVYSAWERHGERPTYTLEGYDMTPNETLTVKHTLSSVKTPCGGIVSFGYEPNDFYFDSQTITGPGLRVKTVTYDGGYTDYPYKWRKKYSYTDDNGVTSGKVTSIPDYGFFNATAYVKRWNLINGEQGDEYNRNVFTARQFSTVSDMTGTSQSVVRYSKVTVTDEGMGNTDGKIGKTEYHYRLGWNAGEDSICIGNNEYVHRTKTRRTAYLQSLALGEINANLSFYVNLRHEDSFPKFTEPITSWCGDFLSEKLIYGSDGRLVESTEYQYSLHPSNKTFAYLQSKYYIRYDVPWAILDFETGFIVDKFYNFQLDILWGANYYRTGSRRLDAIIQTRYSGETSNKTIKTFDYYNVGDVVNVVKSETVTNSDGNTVRNNYTYPFNYNVSPLNSMTNKNMLMTPVEQYTSVNGMVTDGAFVEYKEHGIFIKPDKAFRLHTTRPLSDFSPSNPGGNHDSRYDETISIKWDDTHANIIETREEGDVTTTYIWGYHNSLLVAKIENATYAEVTSYCNPEELQEKTNKELVEIFQYLRENLPNAMVTSYTYDTARNLLSVTDPSGKTASYEYDSASRLKITRDVEDNIINKYEYHYGSSKQ